MPAEGEIMKTMKSLLEAVPDYYQRFADSVAAEMIELRSTEPDKVARMIYERMIASPAWRVDASTMLASAAAQDAALRLMKRWSDDSMADAAARENLAKAFKVLW
jgi:hypothetical protein